MKDALKIPTIFWIEMLLFVQHNMVLASVT